MRSAHSEAEYLQGMLCALGLLEQSTPIAIYTDCEDLYRAIKTTRKVREPNLMSDLKIIRDEERAGYIKATHIPREYMIADELTHSVVPSMLITSFRTNMIRVL